jgi:hypothetical protein
MFLQPSITFSMESPKLILCGLRLISTYQILTLNHNYGTLTLLSPLTQWYFVVESLSPRREKPTGPLPPAALVRVQLPAGYKVDLKLGKPKEHS